MNWLEDKARLTKKIFLLINANNLELYRILKEKQEEIQPIYPFIGFIIERLGAVTDLTVQGRLWDAEIVLRSAMETIVKFVFITTAPDKQEQNKRLTEFWNDLAEVNSLKHSEQAKLNLIHLGTSETHRLAYTPNVLTEEDELKLRGKWSKAERQKLEQKWSFTEIIRSLSKNYRGKPNEIFITLSHCYRMASHVTHGDETGILIIQERNSRTQQEQDTVNFAHYLRLLLDGLTYCSLVSIEAMHFLNLDTSFFIKNQNQINDEMPLINKYHYHVFNDKDYDKYRI